jgi:hypothetical protein
LKENFPEYIRMKHFYNIESKEKIIRWLEICDISFELFKNSFKGHKKEEQVYKKLKKILKNKTSLKIKILSMLERI